MVFKLPDFRTVREIEIGRERSREDVKDTISGYTARSAASMLSRLAQWATSLMLLLQNTDST
jgi:hypothetical protein